MPRATAAAYDATAGVYERAARDLGLADQARRVFVVAVRGGRA